MTQSSDLSRRGLLAGLGASLAVPSAAHAALQCQDVPQGKLCTAGIPSRLAHIAAYQNAQYQSQWCWAACISMVFRYHGYDVDQQTIVEQAYGGPYNLPAQPWTILSKLNRTWVDRRRRRFRSIAQAGASGPGHLAQELSDGMPMIIGTMGHAVVLTALSYAAPWVRGAFGRPTLGMPQVTEAIVRDPWPGRGRRQLSAREWASIAFVARVRVVS